MSEISNKNISPEQKPIVRLYAAFVASVLLSFVPHFFFAAVALLLFTGVMIAAYIMRGRAGEQSLTENHATTSSARSGLPAYLCF